MIGYNFVLSAIIFMMIFLRRFGYLEEKIVHLAGNERMANPPLKKLKAKADSVYSKRLRESQADQNGMVKCYTCNTVKHWKELQCGHYITRTSTALRYYPKNTKPQCSGCNMFNQGRLDVFAINLIKEYGPEILEELQELKMSSLTSSEARILYQSVIDGVQ